MAKEKVNLYLLAIVAIVAVVGIVVLVLNSGTSSLSISDEDLSGQASKKVGAGAVDKTVVFLTNSEYKKMIDSESVPCCKVDGNGNCLCSSEDCNDCK